MGMVAILVMWPRPFTVKSLINAHALINAHPPILTLKTVILGAIFGKILASYKRPSEKMGGGGQIFSPVVSYQMRYI